MSLPFIPQAGQILLFEAQGLLRDPIGSFIISNEKDTRVCHVAMMGFDAMLWTTGALSWCRFGLVEAEKYLQSRKYHVYEWTSEVTMQRKVAMMKACAGFSGQFYGFGKVSKLMLLGMLPGQIQHLESEPCFPEEVKNPFCSQSVAAAAMMGGIAVCQKRTDGSDWKIGTDAITPVNIFQWCEMKDTPIKAVYSDVS